MHFFKYASRQSALRVIESRSFRWSSPVNFNDPFDHQVGFVMDIDPDRFVALMTNSLERIVFDDVIPSVNQQLRLLL